MKFCENPKCLFHRDTAKDEYVLTIVLPGPPLPVGSIIEKSTTPRATITREKFLWRNPKKNIEFFLCDVCNEVAKLITENTGE